MIIGIALLAMFVRGAIIVTDQGGGYDLSIYHYFGDLVLRGQNPYRAPADGPIDPAYADMPPANLGIFAAVLLVRNTPQTLRVFFALIDLALLLGIGLLMRRSLSWRLNLMLFYGFSPLILISWVSVSEDKGIILLGIFLLFVFLERHQATGAFLSTTFLAIYKWIGLLFVAPLSVYFSSRVRQVVIQVAIVLALFGLSHLPYYPDSLAAYGYRKAQTLMNPPIHASITILLARIGLYHPMLVYVLILSSVAVIYGLFLSRKLGIRETIVLTAFFVYIGGGDVGVDRILLITLPFFLIVELSWKRWVALWLVTTWAFLGFISTLNIVHRILSNYPAIERMVDGVFGRRSTPQHAIWMNFFPAVMLGFYLADKFRGKIDWHDKLGQRGFASPS